MLETKNDWLCEAIKEAIKEKIYSIFKENPGKIVVINYDLYMRSMKEVSVIEDQVTFRGDMSVLVRTVSPDPQRFVRITCAVDKKFFIQTRLATINNFNPLSSILAIDVIDEDEAFKRGIVFNDEDDNNN